MILIGEAGHGIIGLRLEHAADEPALGVNPEYRQRIFPPAHGRARCLGQMFDQRGDEDRLTRPRQPGDPKANMRARRKSMRACATARASNRRLVINGKTDWLSRVFRGGEGTGNGREKRVSQMNPEVESGNAFS